VTRSLKFAFPIVATSGRDYPYRLIVPKSVWATALSELVLEQYWSNIKVEAAAFLGNTGREYFQAPRPPVSATASVRNGLRFLRSSVLCWPVV